MIDVQRSVVDGKDMTKILFAMIWYPYLISSMMYKQYTNQIRGCPCLVIY